MLLALAIPQRDVKEPAKELVARFGNLRGILDAPLAELLDGQPLHPPVPIRDRIHHESQGNNAGPVHQPGFPGRNPHASSKTSLTASQNDGGFAVAA